MGFSGKASPSPTKPKSPRVRESPCLGTLPSPQSPWLISPKPCSCPRTLSALALRMCALSLPQLPILPLLGALSKPSIASALPLLPALPGTPVTPGESPSPSAWPCRPVPCWPPGFRPTPPVVATCPQPHLLCCYPQPFVQLSPSPGGPPHHHLSLWALPPLDNGTFVLSLGLWWAGQGEGSERGKSCILFLCICFPGFPQRRAHSGLISGSPAWPCHERVD